MSTTPFSRATLADLLAAVATAPMTARRRQDMTSAVRKVAKLIGRDAAEVPADLRTLNANLNKVSPMAVGISTARWNNVRSLLRSALALIGPVMKGRNLMPISEAWTGPYNCIKGKSDQIRLSRLLRWLSAAQITPDTVSLEKLDHFRTELAEQSLLLRHPGQAWDKISLAWNRSVHRVPGWPQLRIHRETRPKGYTLPWSAFPATLKQDVDGWLARLSGRDFAEDAPSRPLSEETLKSQTYLLRAFASALVLRGRDPSTLNSLATLVTIENFVEGLRFFHERFGPDNTSTAHRFACTLKSVARHWAKAGDATLNQMSAIIRRLDPGRSGMTQKNRDRLLPFNDPELCGKLLMLPHMLRREIERGKLPSSSPARSGTGGRCHRDPALCADPNEKPRWA